MQGRESDAKPVNHWMAWRLAGIPPLEYDILPDFNRDETATKTSGREIGTTDRRPKVVNLMIAADRWCASAGARYSRWLLIYQGAALISTPRAPALLLGQVAAIAG
jgi:hypothetical protein